MASVENIEYLLRQVQSNYGMHPKWVGDLLPIWEEAFGYVNDGALTEAVNGCINEYERAPNVAQVKKKLAERAHGKAKTETRPEGCEHCADSPGRRQFAWHQVTKNSTGNEEYHIRCGTVFCDCAAGNFYVRDAPERSFGRILQRLHGFKETVAVYVTDATQPVLTPDQQGLTLNPNPEARAKDWRAFIGHDDPEREKQRLRLIRVAKAVEAV